MIDDVTTEESAVITCEADVAHSSAVVVESADECKGVQNEGTDVNEVSEEAVDDEIDQEELARDKIVNDVIIHSVIEPIEKKDDVEQEIKSKFADIGVQVIEIRSFTDFRGNFKTSRVKTSPVNLKMIWGRRLGLKNCALLEYEPPPSSFK